MSQSLGNEVAPKSKRGRGFLITGIVLLVVAVLVGVLGTIMVFTSKNSFVDLFRSTPQSTPLSQTRHFDSGIYFVYQDERDQAQIPTSDVTVVATGGAALNVYYPKANETLTINGVTFTDVAGFQVIRGGTYQLTISTTGARVVVGPSLGHAFAAAIPGIALGAFAGFLFLLGLIFLIIGIVKVARRNKKAPTPAVAYPVQPGYPVQPVQPVQLAYPAQQSYQAVAPAQTPYVAPESIQPAAAAAAAVVAAEPLVPAEPVVPIEPAAPVEAVAPQPVAPVAPVAPAAPVTPPPPPVTQAIPAGWYPDPEGAAGYRWWDGSAWTEHRA